MKRSVLILALMSAVASEQPELSMQDLQALDKQQGYSEILDKADLVKPSARTADWNTLVQGAATHVLDQIEKTHSDWRALRTLVAVIPNAELKYAFLKSDKTYLAAKAKALTQVAAACRQDRAEGACGTIVVALADGIDKFPKGSAKDIAKLLPDDYSESIHFWALAAEDDKDVCTSEPQLRLAVLDTLRRSTGDHQVVDAQRAANTCFASLEQDLMTDLVKTHPFPNFAKNACPVLKTHGSSTTAKKKACP
jgi:hypothetical protein